MAKKEILEQNTLKIRYFWFVAICILVLLAAILAHDITRPFYGMHSWAQASGAWAARSHVKYGLDYTKGVSTWAVGMPPVENPDRYWDHPQLNILVASGFMKIFGIHEWSLRLTDILIALPTLLVFMLMVRDISNSKTALLSGFIYVAFPITGYFSMGGFPVLFGTLAMWLYLIISGHTPRKIRKIYYALLALSLFLAIQFSWVGFFFAMGIGFHYVLGCIIKKKMPNWPLLVILAAAPLLSMILNFTVMAAGYGWDVSKITTLFKWRSAKGEMESYMQHGFDWAAWFAKMWEHAATNFTVTGLIIAIVYLIFGQLFITAALKNKDTKRQLLYPCFWLFFLIPFFQLFVLKGCLWQHQTWEMPLAPFFAIALALAIISTGSILKQLANKYFALTIQAILLAGLLTACFFGTKYYYDVRWQPPEKIEFFTKLNKQIPPDKALLSFEDFIVNQNEAKGGFIRPEIAWHLDRRIVSAQSYNEVKQFASTGKYPVYICPAVSELKPLMDQLVQDYPYEVVPGVNGERTKDGKFLKAGMYPYVIFNLKEKK
ncbi:MAG: hypothetical protein A2Y10_16840 [Planctomycetes bacterium GWF2_41_51]|nr:MAG: hypothetical protein A2Y10_16840 [Planctomycetes bacterium GWF2_41_51]HBG28865.1 hypothetical protein [Phycisphaerales bacterium]